MLSGEEGPESGLRPKVRSTPEAGQPAYHESCRRAHGRSTSRSANSEVAKPAMTASTNTPRPGRRRSAAASVSLGGAIPAEWPAAWGDTALGRGWPEHGRSFASLGCG